MNFWEKTTKIVSIAAIALGGALAIGGAAMLGVSSNKTYRVSSINSFDGTVRMVDLDIGFNNYADDCAPTYTEANLRAGMSYSDFISVMPFHTRRAKSSLSNATANPAERNMLTSYINAFNTAIQTYDIMIVRAFLLPIGSVMAILGVVFLVLNIKKAKVDN